MSIRNTLGSNQWNLPVSLQKYGMKSPKEASLQAMLNTLQSTSPGSKNDTFTPMNSYLDSGSLDSQLLAAKQKMTVPSLVEKFKRGESFSEQELSFMKKAKGGVEELTKAMNAMKSSKESEVITDLLDKYKVTASDRKKMVIEIGSDSAKSGAYTVKLSGLSDAETAKKIESELNSSTTHGKNMFTLFISTSKTVQSLPKEFLAYNSKEKTNVTDYLKTNGFAGKLSSLGVKDGKITGLPEKLDTLLNDPKLTAGSTGKSGEAFAIKQSLLKVMAQDSLNSGKEIPSFSAKLTVRGDSLSVIEQSDLLSSAKSLKFPKSSDMLDKLFQKNPTAWFESVVGNKNSTPSTGINLLG